MLRKNGELTNHKTVYTKTLLLLLCLVPRLSYLPSRSSHSGTHKPALFLSFSLSPLLICSLQMRWWIQYFIAMNNWFSYFFWLTLRLYKRRTSLSSGHSLFSLTFLFFILQHTTLGKRLTQNCSCRWFPDWMAIKSCHEEQLKTSVWLTIWNYSFHIIHKHGNELCKLLQKTSSGN